MKHFLSKYKYDVFFYLSVVVSIFINFIIFYFQIENSIFAHNSIFNPLIYTFLNSLIFSIPYFLFQKKKVLLFVYLFAIDILLIANIMYFHFYNSIIPITSYSNVTNLNGLFAKLLGYLTLMDSLFIINTLVLVLVYRFLFKNKLNHFSLKVSLLVPVTILLTTVFIGSASILVAKKRGLIEKKFYYKDLDQPFFVSYYGLLTLWSFQSAEYFSNDNSPITNKEQKEIDNYLAVLERNRVGVKQASKDKNLIIILVESMSTWPIGVQNEQAMPYLAALRTEKDVIYVPNVLPQTNHGHSSDAQLILNTGLLPLYSGVVASSYSTQYYPSLAGILRNKKQYYSATIMGNNPSTWNQQSINKAYNMDSLISVDNLKQDEIIGMGISDKSVFRQTIHILKNKTKKPFYIQLVTLSTHDAVDFEHYTSKIKFPAHYSKDVINYIKSMEYMDASIKQFVTDLKKVGLYDESVIVIVSDHEGMHSEEISKYSPELISKLEKNKTTFVPLFILNSGIEFKPKPNQVIGYVDIYPTILDIMNVEQNNWYGVGNSIFSKQPPTFAIDKKMNCIGDTSNTPKSEIQLKTKAWQLSNLLIKKKYFNSTINNN